MTLTCSWFKPALIHAIEAIVVLGIAILVVHFFPEQQTEVGVIAVGLLAFLAKGLRASNSPVPDYVNGSK